MFRIELLVDAKASPGEGPLWDVPENIGSMALRESGGAICSLRDGFYTKGHR